MNKNITYLILLFLIVSCNSQSKTKKEEIVESELCPVLEDEVLPEYYIELKGGQKIYFCTQSCVNLYKKDSSKYIE